MIANYLQDKERTNEIGIYKGIKIKIFLISSYQRPALVTDN
ncbi:hypothetical protein O53_4732 [Microcystis aeruginosa TAIHU98]|uniref:Uncharacterized protein n=1 Tax=Microcystis aeruginosa TAIHU98 TaxID=1134457 RepID=L7E2X2_MICAE|nr:hypothetical protein O53_4732 [Microcystis aeruginosa TAIHU98]